MSNHNINWLIIVVVLFSLAAIGGFVYLILPNIDSPAVAGLAGVVVGAFVGMFGSILTAIVGAWRTSKETEERLKDRVSNHDAFESTASLNISMFRSSQWSFVSSEIVFNTLRLALISLQTERNNFEVISSLSVGC